ncbi:hypothetical protein R1sor_023935 [Riccia sorocarpa]|uniref:Reverse transcriptase domain-containing protein n=1 Tax=Riccia sorocarpa TaxID=122646 RepID=A0ABD3GT44_9MARC
MYGKSLESMQYVIVRRESDYPLSDHLPVSLFLSGEGARKDLQNKSLFFKVDPRTLKDPNIRRNVADTWQSHKAMGPLTSPHCFFEAWADVRRLLKEAQYEEYKQLTALEGKKKQLRSMIVRSSDQAGLEEYARLAEEVRRLQAIHDHKIKLWSRVRFLLEGETNSAYYLKKFKKKCLQSRVSSLHLDDGTVVRSQTGIVKEVYRFFSNLYDSPQFSHDDLLERDRFLSKLKPVITPQQWSLLLETPSLREFSDILADAPKGKSPGIDGFCHQSIAALWDLIGEDFTLMTGVIACRLALILPAVVPHQQQGFIKGRGVQACILNLLFESDHLKKRRKQAVFVMLDLEKAYDKLSLDFLWDVLSKLDFGDEFIALLKALSIGASARVQINSCLSPEFLIKRGVRLGCPLAPFLFALSTIPFIVSLQKEVKGGNIKTMNIRGVAELNISALADDTAVFLDVDESSFHKFQVLLKRFQAASGAKINFRKSKAMIIGIFRMSHVKTLRRLFRSLLWGISCDGRPKVPLVSWDVLSAPTSSGGLGLWDLHQLNHAFFCKSVGSLITSPSDAQWPKLFWGMCRVALRSSNPEHLLLADLHRETATPLFNRMIMAWDIFRDCLVWSPQLISLPSQISVASGLTLLLKCGFLSKDEAALALAFGWTICPGWNFVSSREEDLIHIFFACHDRESFWTVMGSKCSFISNLTRELRSSRNVPSALATLFGSSPAHRLAGLLVFTHAARSSWRRRNQILFGGSGKALSWGSTLIAAADILLTEAVTANGKRKTLLRGALDLLLPAIPPMADRLRFRFSNIFDA